MTATAEATRRISVDDWCRAFEDEYLTDYLPNGGSVVRFVSGSESDLAEAVSRLVRRAVRGGLWYRTLDPRETDAAGRPVTYHRIETFYQGVIQGYDWRDHLESQLRRHLESRGLFVNESRPVYDLPGIADQNEREVTDLAREVRRFGTDMIRDSRMASEFRFALVALAKEMMLRESGSPSMEEVVLQWLHGKSVPGGAKLLKSIGVYDRIRSTNARSALASFMRWLQRTGTPGALVVLDLRPYEAKKLTAKQRSEARNQALREAIRAGRQGSELEALLDAADLDSGGPYFGDRAFLQILDLLRHFIDDIEAFPGLGLVILTSDAFYREDSPRNYLMYNALQTRIGQEVRDSARPNPVAMLAHLGGDR